MGCQSVFQDLDRPSDISPFKRFKLCCGTEKDTDSWHRFDNWVCFEESYTVISSRSRVRTQIIGLLQRPKLPASNITIQHLKQDKDIMILPSDKGQAVVVLDRVEYDNKIRTLLDNCSTYQIITKNPTPSLERKMNSTLLSLHRDAQLSKQLYDQLRSTAGLTPRLYGLPKIRKSGRPLRLLLIHLHITFLHPFYPLWLVIHHQQSRTQAT